LPRGANNWQVESDSPGFDPTVCTGAQTIREMVPKKQRQRVDLPVACIEVQILPDKHLISGR